MALVDTSQGQHRMGKAKAYSVGAKRRSKRERRRGRPPHDVVFREPNGRASRATGRGATHDEPVQLVVLRQRTQIVGEEHASSPFAESALGVLYLLGRLADGATKAEREAANRAAYDAGVWWRETVHGLHRILGAPVPYSRSPAWGMVGGGGGGGDEHDLSSIKDPELRAWLEGELIRRKQRFLGAYEQGRAAMGDDALAVEALVIHDRAEQIEQARRGLAALVKVRGG